MLCGVAWILEGMGSGSCLFTYIIARVLVVWVVEKIGRQVSVACTITLTEYLLR